MNIRDLIPWSRGGHEVQVRREGGQEPALALPSDIDRMFDDFWRRFSLPIPGIWERRRRPWEWPHAARRCP